MATSRRIEKFISDNVVSNAEHCMGRPLVKRKFVIVAGATLAAFTVLFSIPPLGAGARKGDSKLFEYLAHVGVAWQTPEVACLSIANPSLRIGSRVFLISTAFPQKVSRVEVMGKQQKPCVQSDGSGTSLDNYELRRTVSSEQVKPPRIAVYGFRGKFAKRGENVTADLDGDGLVEFFRSCTSREGIHFTIWSGSPLQGTRRWHRYVYLGYSVEPTCTEAETAPDPT